MLCYIAMFSRCIVYYETHLFSPRFPHDEHDLTIKLAIISKREMGDRWDRRKWKIGLATENDRYVSF